MNYIKKLNISFEDGIVLAKEAIRIARMEGFNICATIVDASGVQVVSIRDDFANQITPESSFKKAYTAVAIKVPTLMLVNAFEKNPTLGQFSEINSSTIVYGGGVPITINDDVVGAIGIAGAPGGDKDHRIAEKAIACMMA